MNAARGGASLTLQDPTAPLAVPLYNRVPQLLGVLQDTDRYGFTFSVRAYDFHSRR